MRILKINVLLLCCLLITLTGYAKPPLQSQHHTSGYIQVDKGKLFYQTFGSGTPVIVLHGGPGLDQSYLQPQMLALAKHHQIVFYDQRGSGQSLETDRSAAYINIDQFTRDLEALRKQLGFEKIIVLGHSWGGLLAMNYSIKYPGHVSALILMDSAAANAQGRQAFYAEFAKITQPIKNDIAPLFNDQAFEKLNTAQIRNLYRKLFRLYFYNPEKVAELTISMGEKSAKSGEKIATTLAETSAQQPDFDWLPQLKQLSIPTLVVHCRQDIVPLWTAQDISKAIPNAHMLTLEKCGHFPYIEVPEQVFPRIEDFMSTIR